ncbi:MAG: hypothetical protein SV201_14625 [Pseudomonadota bacterium]|nr:hypothetical protein [Pseudomonadota bacterium]
MSKKSIIAMFISAGLLATSAAYADHNSVWGAGTANMPNDIHNTRIEDDNDTFLELVQQGGGADSVNRYDTDSTTTTMGSGSLMGGSMSGSLGGAMSRGGRR